MTIEYSNLFERIDMREFIRNSNLIEGVDNPFEDELSLRAWRWLAEQPHLSKIVVMDLHKFIMLGKLPAADLGRNRNVDVYVAGRQCPSPTSAFMQLGEWISKMRGYKRLSPKQMHIQYEHIHPFIDGNGRTGRMLYWWHQIKNGQPPSLISYEQRQEYYGWFK